MMPEELLRSLHELIETTPQAELMASYRGFKFSHTPEEQLILDAGFDLYLSGISLQSNSRRLALALIHGIRTTGVWQEKVRFWLQDQDGVEILPVGYEFFDVIRFLGPWRKAPIERVKTQLRDIQQLYPNHDLIVVAHSFGTYIVATILSEAPDIKISRLLLCGSIIPSGFRWDRLPNQFTQQRLVNEVGTKDWWPVLARLGSWGYGCSGSFGFKSTRVLDRYFDYGHSDFFTEEHFSRFWRPFVIKGEVVHSPWDSQRPPQSWFMSALGSVPMMNAPILILSASLLAGIYLVVKPFIS